MNHFTYCTLSVSPGKNKLQFLNVQPNWLFAPTKEWIYPEFPSNVILWTRFDIVRSCSRRRRCVVLVAWGSDCLDWDGKEMYQNKKRACTECKAIVSLSLNMQICGIRRCLSSLLLEVHDDRNEDAKNNREQRAKTKALYTAQENFTFQCITLPISAKHPRKMIEFLRSCWKLKHITMNFNIFPSLLLQIPRQLR